MSIRSVSSANTESVMPLELIELMSSFLPNSLQLLEPISEALEELNTSQEDHIDTYCISQNKAANLAYNIVRMLLTTSEEAPVLSTSEGKLLKSKLEKAYTFPKRLPAATSPAHLQRAQAFVASYCPRISSLDAWMAKVYHEDEISQHTACFTITQKDAVLLHQLPTNLRGLHCTKGAKYLTTGTLEWSQRLQNLEELTFPIEGLDLSTARFLPPSLHTLRLHGMAPQEQSIIQKLAQALAHLSRLNELSIPSSLLDASMVTFPYPKTITSLAVHYSALDSIPVEVHRPQPPAHTFSFFDIFDIPTALFYVIYRIIIFIKLWFTPPEAQPSKQYRVFGVKRYQRAVEDCGFIATIPLSIKKLSLYLDDKNQHLFLNLKTLKRFKQLRELTIRTSRPQGPSFLRQLSPRLKKLSVSSCGFIYRNSLKYLSEKNHLQILDISSTPIDGKDLLWLPHSITTIYIHNCENISKEHVKAFLKERPHVLVDETERPPLSGL